MLTLKKEVDEELDDFPIVLEGEQKNGEPNEVSIKSKLESIKKQMNSYNLKEKTAALQDQPDSNKFKNQNQKLNGVIDSLS